MAQSISYIKIGLVLIFFCAIGISCKTAAVSDYEILYKDGKPAAIGFPANTPGELITVFLDDQQDTPMLGEVARDADYFSFTPVVPFTGGNTYTIYIDDKWQGQIRFETSSTGNVPYVQNIFPTSDTVPENLLKMYIEFSRPMQEVRSALDYITVWNDTENKAEDIFLELPTELWNAEHTRLTLWLDPGRIKTDLIPNREKGLPIREGNTYTLRISPEWLDAEGNPLDAPYIKTFAVGARDARKPRPLDWSLDVPESGSRDPLIVHFGESMDAILANESLSVWNEKNQMVSSGRFALGDEEQSIAVLPAIPWESGVYRLTCRHKLEDLAGNNLDRLFDSDLGDQSDENVLNFVVFTIE